jgi:hypothetical protein
MYPEIQTSDVQAHARLTAWFDQLGADVCDVLADADGRYIVLEDGQRFSDVSAVLRRIMAGVDGWPIPPAGLCVVEERIVILRSLSPMTFFHETGHLLDLALGGGVYLSGIEPKLRRAFANATAFVTPYAASANDEHWAESQRAWWGDVANDPHSLWPRATRERLQAVNPTMFEIVREIFEETIPARAAEIRERRRLRERAA